MPDLTKVTWQLNVALLGAIFSVFALIHDSRYIYYGFFTFLYGILSHVVDLFSKALLGENKNRIYILSVLQLLLTVLWLILSASYGFTK